MQASSLGCGQGQKCLKTEGERFYCQSQPSPYSYRGVRELRERQMQKAGASIYLGTAKELLVSTSAIMVCVRGENSVWGGGWVES